MLLVKPIREVYLRVIQLRAELRRAVESAPLSNDLWLLAALHTGPRIAALLGSCPHHPPLYLKWVVNFSMPYQSTCSSGGHVTPENLVWLLIVFALEMQAVFNMWFPLKTPSVPDRASLDSPALGRGGPQYKHADDTRVCQKRHTKAFIVLHGLVFLGSRDRQTIFEEIVILYRAFVW